MSPSIQKFTNHALEFHFMTLTNHPINNMRIINIKWHAPQKGWIKLNIYSAYDNLKSGLGGIFRNNKGNWIVGFQKFNNVLCPLHIEL